MFNKQQLIVILSSLMFLGGFSGCSSDADPTTTAEYNELVDKYNTLADKHSAQVKKYNAQTLRNVQNDTVIEEASLKLSELDRRVNDFNAKIREAYDFKEAEMCSSSLAMINRHLRPGLEKITSSANALSQGVLERALKRISDDLSSYKDSAKSQNRQDMLRAKETLSPGLRGIKSFSRQSLNRLIDDYNADCARTSKKTKPKKSAVVTKPKLKNRVVTVDDSGKRSVITHDELKKRYAGSYDSSAYNNFADLADLSGGFIGFSPTPKLFSDTVDVVLEAILNSAGDKTDVALVIDTTGSMGDDMDNVKKNMARLITQLQPKVSSIGLKLSVVLYRDKGERAYEVKVAQKFTSDLNKINSAVQAIRTGGGGDHPEAVLDALEVTLEKLSWRPRAQRSVVLIGDAPGHKRTWRTRIGTKAMVEKYKEAGLGMIIYPILVSN